jgi:hypothetical protein
MVNATFLHAFLLKKEKTTFRYRKIIQISALLIYKTKGCIYYSNGRGMHIGYWWECQKERDHWEDQDVGGWTILKWILER